MMWGRTVGSRLSGNNNTNKTLQNNNKAGEGKSVLQPHPFAGTLAQKASKFTLPWVRDDQKKPSGGRGSSINIEELAKPLEQGAGGGGGGGGGAGGGPFSNRTHFKYQKAPVVIPFISLKNFKKTNENLVAPSSEVEKSKLKKQQSDLIQQLTSPSSSFDSSPPPAPPLREEEDDVSDLLDELESVKVRYQEGLKKKIESEAIENARRSQEQNLNRDYPRRRSSSHESTEEEDAIHELENRLEMGDMTVLFDNSFFKHTAGSNLQKHQLDEGDLAFFEQFYETELLPEMKEMHKEELYKVHLALKDVVKEKEVLGRRMKKLKKLRPKVRANKKEWMEQEISECLNDIKENGFASVEALKRDVSRVVRTKYGEGMDVVHDQFKETFDEMAVGISLSPTLPLRRKVATLVFATLQFNNFMEEYPDYDNATQLKLEEEEDRLRMEEFVQEAPILHDVAFHYEKTGHLEFPGDEDEESSSPPDDSVQQH